jgi:phage terminase large subunit-like protein
MIEGESGIMAICPNHERPTYKKGERKLVWPNGATSLVFTADEPERLRGKQHEALWADELAAWRYPESWDQAMLGLRLGFWPQAVVTTTPRPTQLIKDLVADPAAAITYGTTYSNIRNLAPAFINTVIRTYEGTRLGQQELMGIILGDNPAALWMRTWLDTYRVKKIPQTLTRVVVGVDPSISDGENAAECGIVVSGIVKKGDDVEGYVLGDYSLRGTPKEWADAIITAYNRHQADRVVAEVNQGGMMVETILRSVDKHVSYKAVHAARGKQARAEPVSALYEQGRVHHFGAFRELEDEMCEWVPGQTPESPNRIDALVWGMTDLMVVGKSGRVVTDTKRRPGANKDQFPEQVAEQVKSLEEARRKVASLRMRK